MTETLQEKVKRLQAEHRAHNLANSEKLAFAVRLNDGDTRFGGYLFQRYEDTYVLSGTGWEQPFRGGRIVDAWLTSAEAVTKTYAEGDRVVIAKFQDEYAATITKVGKTRLTFDYVTKGGKAKTITHDSLVVIERKK